MYFNENKENTNIDSEFKNEKKLNFDFDKYKKPLMIAGGILLFIILLIIIILILKGRNKYHIVLNGDENIIIYQGANFIDPGYTAYDNSKHDLTSQVTVKENLDSQSIGTYTIVYSLHNSSKTRTVTVIDRPTIITVIYLNGDKNMTLKVGDTFTDPGYSAIDAIDGDITSKVTVEGAVNTSQKGVYRIIYSVVNSEGVTTTETRMVTVE